MKNKKNYIKIKEEQLYFYTPRITLSKMIKYRGNYEDQEIFQNFGIEIEDLLDIVFGEKRIDLNLLYNISKKLDFNFNLYFNRNINWKLVEFIDFYLKNIKKEINLFEVGNL